MTYEALQSAARSLTSAFSTRQSLDTILFHFSTCTSTTPSAIEHGLKTLAPFLGREFTSLSGVREYFGLLQELLDYEDMEFDELFVDEKRLKVCVRGRARFGWRGTGEWWDEVFVWVLDYVVEGEEVKVRRYQVWADSGAAYLASKGRLRELERTSP